MDELSSDSRLINEFLKGSKQAFGELMRAHQKKVYFLALRFTGNHHDAEEAVQEIFVKVHGSLKKLREKKYFSTWLYRITYNQCMTLRQKRKDTEDEDTLNMVADKTAEYHAKYELKEAKEKIREAIECLPKQQKAVFLLRMYEDLKFSEIAEITNLSIGGVKANYFNAVIKIKDEVRKKYDL